MENRVNPVMAWPDLTYESWAHSLKTLHLWTQIIGKIRLKRLPWTNHSWHVTLYISTTGLSTGPMPYPGGLFQVEFDFIRHQLLITTSKPNKEVIRLFPKSVATFYQEVVTAMAKLDIECNIHPVPNEVEPPIPFAEDEEHRSYDLQKVQDFWWVLVRTHLVLTEFRSRFIGKSSPVHFFWGGFDLALTRFSGRPAPPHPGGMPNMPLAVMREAYSHEVSSCGFWPGNDAYPHPAFYAYCYPVLAAYKEQPVKPKAAFYSEDLGEFLLHYEDVAKAKNPEKVLMDFFQSTYEAAADAGHWDREGMERDFSTLPS